MKGRGGEVEREMVKKRLLMGSSGGSKSGSSGGFIGSDTKL